MGVLGEISGEGLNRRCSSFLGAAFHMLMHQHDRIEGVWGHSLVSLTALLLSRIWLAQIVLLLLLISLILPVLGSAWH